MANEVPAVAVPTSARVRRLGEVLVDRGLVTASHVDRALWYQHNAGGRIGAALIHLGHLAEPDFLRVLAPLVGAPAIDLDPRAVDPRVARIVPSRLAHQLGAVAIAVRGERLVVAMAEPGAPRAVERLEAAVGMRVETGLATDPAIERALARLYTPDDAVVRRAHGQDAATVIGAVDASTARALDRLLGSWIRDTLDAGARSLVIERQPLHLVARCETARESFELRRLEAIFHRPLITRLRRAAGLGAPAARGWSQHAPLAVPCRGATVEVWLTITPDTFGARARIEVSDAAAWLHAVDGVAASRSRDGAWSVAA